MRVGNAGIRTHQSCQQFSRLGVPSRSQQRIRTTQRFGKVRIEGFIHRDSLPR
ncbi:MAG TPA: hypothetical protein VFI32_10490 [Rhodanobacteraceae bacterium]|nr:hypothetical protein [Rhodanobacteraceae bacterium]